MFFIFIKLYFNCYIMSNCLLRNKLLNQKEFIECYNYLPNACLTAITPPYKPDAKAVPQDG